MAIQPIDLSTMYSQMDNVAKFSASQNQLAQVVNQVAADRVAQDTSEKAKTVQEVAKEDSEAGTINKDARNGSSNEQRQAKDRKNKDSQEEEAPKQYEFTDPRLGRHIDITG
ncbi:MAG: hypothetical protein J6W60_10140 [Treponema sp.]|nr:hypothetical protein [Treponema sp.]MBP5753197.1 hypothetical protein [Treponema sp.]MBR4005622.1 hypothetical protein [Treponema sp.]